MVLLNADNLQYNRSLFDFFKISFHIFEAENTWSKSHKDMFASEVYREDGLQQHECCGRGLGLVG